MSYNVVIVLLLIYAFILQYCNIYKTEELSNLKGQNSSFVEVKIFSVCEFYWSLEYGMLVAKTPHFLATPPSFWTLFPNLHGNG